MGSTNVFAQETIVKGKVTDAGTGEPLAFAVVTFSGLFGVRATTDFEGNYLLKTAKQVDSIRVFLVGFEPQVIKINRNQSQAIDFQLKQERKELATTIFKAKANPAHRILDGVIANKKYNSPGSLNYYECENFNKTELAVNNISSKIKKNILT